MKRKRKRIVFPVFLISLVLFLGIFGYIISVKFLRLEDPKVFETQDGMVLGINEDGFDSELFLVSADSGVGSFIRRHHLAHEGNRTILDAELLEDGTVLFLEELLYADGTSTDRVFSWIPGKSFLKEDTVSAFQKAKETDARRQNTGRQDTGRQDTAYAFEDENGIEFIRVFRGGEIFEVRTVRPSLRHILPAVLTAFFLSALVFVILLVVSYHFFSAGIYPGIRFRLSMAAVVLVLLFISFFTWFLSRFYYAFSCRDEVYHCADTVVLKSGALDETALNRILSKEQPLTAKSFADLWMYASEEDTRALRERMRLNDTKSLFLISEDELRIVVKEGDDLIQIDGTQRPDPVMSKVTDPLRETRYRKCFERRTPLVLMTSGRGGQYAACYLPVKLRSGREAILGAHLGVSLMHLSLFNQQQKVIRLCIILQIVMLSVILILLSRSLAPLKELRNAVAGVAAGKLSSRAEVSGANEITRTADAFNRMAEQLEAQSAGADSWRRFYEAFFPARLLTEFSGKKLESALLPGFGWSAPRVVLSLEDVPQEHFDTAIRTAGKEGGQLAGLADGEMKFLFREEGDGALRVSEILNKEFKKPGFPKIYGGIASGEASIFVAGSVYRFNVCERDSNEASRLSRMAKILDIPVLLTEPLFLEAEQKNLPFHFRCLGRIGMEDYIPDKPVYELLDAEEPEVQALKQRLNKFFDRGREAYAAGDYRAARREMIRVLDNDPGDLAARSYILCCDRKEPPAVCQAEKRL